MIENLDNRGSDNRGSTVFIIEKDLAHSLSREQYTG